MAKKKNPLVFMDVSIDGDPFERMTFELFSDIAPMTAENFRALCTGEKGIGPKTGKVLHYKGSFFHRVIKGSMAQGGDFITRDGTSGESIYDGKFPDEPPRLKHDGPGFLSMPIADRDTVGSQFIITFKANQNLDRKYVVFGKLVQGNEVLKKIENVGDEEGIPTVTVKMLIVVKSVKVKVVLPSLKEKRKNKLKRGNDASDAISYEARRKGKHKKSSRDIRKRRRRYYSSDSESSSDSETESSESNSDSDSYLSSSSESDISSSSDDSVSGSPPRFPERNLSRNPVRSRSMSPARSLSKSPLRGRKSKSISRSPVRASSHRSISRSPVRSRSRRSPSRSPPRSSAGAHSQRSISRSPQRSSHRSKSRSSGRAPPRRSPSRSPLKETSTKYRRSYSRSPTPVRRVRSPPADRGQGLSRSVSPDASPRRIKRGRGFSERYSYARRYRTPSPDRSPVRSYRYSGRIDNERYHKFQSSVNSFLTMGKRAWSLMMMAHLTQEANPLIKLNPQHPILSSSLPFVFSRGDNMNRPGDWNCRSCQHLNFQRRDSCQRCGEPRPGGERGDYGSFGGRGGSSFGFTGPDVRPGDWYCTVGNCGAHNFASRSSCFKCGAAKDDLSGGFEGDIPRMRGYGFASGSSSRSNWKSGDWICARSGCNEHNFASRMECFRCNAPRDSTHKSSY
ncbi:hypothetical protein GQ457_07G041440 [Hibiscus cannabinus]